MYTCQGPSADLHHQDLVSLCPPLGQSLTEHDHCELVTASVATRDPFSPRASVVYACHGPVLTWAFRISFHLGCPLLGQSVLEHSQCELITAGQTTQQSSSQASVVYACQGPVLTWAFTSSLTEHDHCESVTTSQVTQHPFSLQASVVGYTYWGPVLTWAFRISCHLVLHWNSLSQSAVSVNQSQPVKQPSSPSTPEPV